MSEVTRILSAIEEGDPHAAKQLLPLVYDELRKLAAAKLAQEKPGQTLQATALVHEAYIRLVDRDKVQRWDSRGHFFAAAAEAMRRILLNRARDKKCLKRGGRFQRLELERLAVVDDASDEDLVAIDDALRKNWCQSSFPSDIRMGSAFRMLRTSICFQCSAGRPRKRACFFDRGQLDWRTRTNAGRRETTTRNCHKTWRYVLFRDLDPQVP
jgi:RNA polymerase sigma factor (TIGR02999 family)